MQLSPYAIPGIMHTIKPGNHNEQGLAMGWDRNRSAETKVKLKNKR